MANMTENYRDCLEYLTLAGYEEVNGYDFYRDIFPDNENAGEYHTDYSRPNAIYLYHDTEQNRLRRRIMLNDTWENDYMTYVENNPMTLCSGLTYRRMSNRLENAQRMNALIIDLDDVDEKKIMNLFLWSTREELGDLQLPLPTYLALSGNGLHIYYVLDKPLDLFPNIKLQAKQLKHAMTDRVWQYKSTSNTEVRQYGSLNQGFRMVGSFNDKYDADSIVRGFRVGSRITIDELNACVKPENRVDLTRPFRPTQITKKKAEELYPEWYQRVIVEGKKNKKKWDIAGKQGDALYRWWLGRATDNNLIGGHRYHFMMCLAIYACKCDVPKSRLRADLKEVFEKLKMIPHENELTMGDVRAAAEAYDKELYCFTIRDIEKYSHLKIDRNRRNYQKQADHLEIARMTRDIKMKRQGRKWTDDSGRPSAEQQVIEYRLRYRDAKPKDCIANTGLSKNTVYKWWNAQPSDMYSWDEALETLSRNIDVLLAEQEPEYKP